MSIRVLVVDDQLLVRAGFAALIRTTPGLQVVGEASDGAQAVAQVAATNPGVVLMDIRMPGQDGVTATRQILSAETGPRPKVLVLTTFDQDEHVFAALRAGASGFLLKDTPPERLLAAIKEIAAGDVLLAPSVTRRLVQQFATTPEPAWHTPRQLQALTTREIDVLRLVGRGLTNPDIASRLFITEATVKSHLGRLMTKLNLTSRAQAVVTAYENGLIKPGDNGS